MNNPTKHHCKECGHEIEIFEKEDMELIAQMKKVSKFDHCVGPLTFSELLAREAAESQQEKNKNAKPRAKRKSAKLSAAGATTSQA